MAPATGVVFFIGRSNTKVTVVVTGTPTAPTAGTTATSAGVSPPPPPAPVVNWPLTKPSGVPLALVRGKREPTGFSRQVMAVFGGQSPLGVQVSTRLFSLQTPSTKATPGGSNSMLPTKIPGSDCTSGMWVFMSRSKVNTSGSLTATPVAPGLGDTEISSGAWA